MDLTARLEYRVRQGQLFQLPVRLPTGWEVEGVELDPADQLRGYGVRDGAGAGRASRPCSWTCAGRWSRWARAAPTWPGR